ncbi:hypothetical protein IWQ62_000008 [Dispira parvispora]|uniref:Uncharacterized protein n=1 Tax=Dispira parvispora TaxID=1520584 RepID=A0A9W8AVL2_9FUNG|nr:hypothetical protein IWQ62_000008 [Dispira parvispora]
MRAITISVVALIAYCTIVPVSSGSLPVVTTTSPSTVHLARRQEDDSGEIASGSPAAPKAPKPDVSKIVADHPELGEVDANIVYLAFCSKTGESTCMANYDEARNQFWNILKDKDISEGQRKGADLIIAQGDATYVRLLFAGGTIFCKKSDGTYTDYIEKFYNGPATRLLYSPWVKGITYNQDYFLTALQKYFTRFQLDQEIKDLDKVENTVANKGYTACYDVTMRDGLDVMVKYSAIYNTLGFLQPILEILKPQGRFHSFILGSLYDSILLEKPEVMKFLSERLDCTKVEESYKAFCDKIQAAIKGGDVSAIEKDSTIIDPDHLSYDRNHAFKDIIDTIINFNRGTIDLARFLDQ